MGNNLTNNNIGNNFMYTNMGNFPNNNPNNMLFNGYQNNSQPLFSNHMMIQNTNSYNTNINQPFSINVQRNLYDNINKFKGNNKFNITSNPFNTNNEGNILNNRVFPTSNKNIGGIKTLDESEIFEKFGKRGWFCVLCNNFNYESTIYFNYLNSKKYVQ